MKKTAITLISTLMFSLLTLFASTYYSRADSATNFAYLPLVERNYSNTLVICLGQEPEDLYIYGANALAKNQVLAAVYDGPIDANSFSYQAVILEKLPAIADGDASIEALSVSEGDTVMDAYGNVVSLQPGTLVIPSGTNSSVTYTGGSILMDQMSATFKLKPGLLWSDGTPLTAADSVYAFHLAADPASITSKFVIERTSAYSKIDDRTVRWQGLPGFINSTYYLNFWGPAPEHVWGAYTAKELLSADVSNLSPLGWGPYIIDDWAPGEYIQLDKSENYFRAGESLPKFDHLIFRFVGTDSNANLASLLSGKCDVLDQTATGGIEPFLPAEDEGLLDILSTPGTIWEHLDFGIQHVSYDDGYDPGSERPNFFGDVRIRRAFAHCINRQGIVDSLFYGVSEVPNTIVPSSHPLYESSTPTYEFDITKGQALLDQVGWQDTDADGILEADGVPGIPDGTEFEIGLETTNAGTRQAATQQIAGTLAQCGIKVDLTYYDSGEWFKDGPEGRLFGRQFDLAQFSWLTAVNPPCDLYTSSAVPGPFDGTWIPVMDPSAGSLSFPFGWGGNNVTGYYNPEYDAACNSALTTRSWDPNYASTYQDTLRIFSEDLPAIPLYSNYKAIAVRPEVTELQLDPTAITEFWNLEVVGKSR